MMTTYTSKLLLVVVIAAAAACCYNAVIVDAAIIPIEEAHENMNSMTKNLHLSQQQQQPKMKLLLRNRNNSSSIDSENNATFTARYLGWQFEDTIIEAKPSSSIGSELQDEVVDEDRHGRLLSQRSAMAFRVHTQYGSPSVSIDQLWGSLFSNGNSVKHQLSRCSMGQFQLNPTNYGIRDIYINAGHNSGMNEISQMAEAAAIQSIGGGVSDIRHAAQHVIFVLPNRGDNFVGSAEVCPNGIAGTSYFGDTYALSLSVLMHELAHNLNLRHAGLNGNQYGDVSGMMGISSGQTDGNPLQCYNACNHWTLGWYPNQRLDVSGGLGAPITVHVVAFVDADQAAGGQYVLVKLPGNLYMQYNRAKEHNSGTRDRIDQLVIVWDSSGSNQGDTHLVTGLDMSNSYYNSGSVVVQVCNSYMNTGNGDFMVVSIGSSYTDCNSGGQVQAQQVQQQQQQQQPQQQQQQQQQQQSTKRSWGSSWGSWRSSTIVEEEEDTSASNATTTTSSEVYKPNNWW